MTTTINVTLLRRHNLGNYEHVEGSITVGAAVEDGQDVAEAAARLQQQIIPLLTVDALTKAQTKAVKAQTKAATAKVTPPTEATPEDEATRKVVTEAPKAEEPPPAETPKAAGSNISVADARKAIQQACITDPAKSSSLVALLHEKGLAKFKDLPDADVPAFYRQIVVEQG